MSDRTRSLIPVETLHETDESKVDLLAILCGTGASRNCLTVRCRSGVFVGQLNAFLRHRQQSPPRSLPQFAEKGCPSSVLEVRCWKPSWCTIFGFWTAASILCGTSTSRSCSMVRCRKEFRLEDGMRSRGPVSNTVKLSANLERRDIHDPLECPLLEAVTVYHLRHLDKLECRGTARRFAAECDPVECVSAQRGGQSCENCATDRRRQWCRQRRCILGVCAPLALPTVGAEQTDALSQKHSELLGFSKNPSNLGRGQSQTSTCNLTVPHLPWSLPEQP